MTFNSAKLPMYEKFKHYTDLSFFINYVYNEPNLVNYNKLCFQMFEFKIEQP